MRKSNMKHNSGKLVAVTYATLFQSKVDVELLTGLYSSVHCTELKSHFPPIFYSSRGN